jgi:hypothetical protein
VSNLSWGVQIFPNVINLQSEGVFVAFIELPKPYNANNVVKETVICDGAPAMFLVQSDNFPQVFGAVFQTSALKGVQTGNNVPFTVTGDVNNNGQLFDFSGSQNVTVINSKITGKDSTVDIPSWSAADIFGKCYNNK